MISANAPIISYFGHATFKVFAPPRTVIYVDPFANGDYSEAADIVLITHDHFDHNQIDKVSLKESTTVIRPEDVIGTDSNGNVTYICTDCNGIRIQPVPACNENHPIDKCAGFVIDIDGMRIYFAGDTSKTDAMESQLPSMRIDYAFLPSDGTYNMGIEECGECARAIGAKHVAAIHTVPCASPEDLSFDEAKAASLSAPGAFVFRPGESMVLEA